jgi:hypothetical protein
MNRYALGIRVTFRNQQACRDYMNHLLHQELLQNVEPLADNVVVVNYPIV